MSLSFDDSAFLRHRLVCHADEEHHERTRPSVLYRPSVSLDGDQWCALYGDDIQRGVAGFGASPAEAMADFDRAWFASSGGGQ